MILTKLGRFQVKLGANIPALKHARIASFPIISGRWECAKFWKWVFTRALTTQIPPAHSMKQAAMKPFMGRSENSVDGGVADSYIGIAESRFLERRSK